MAQSTLDAFIASSSGALEAGAAQGSDCERAGHDGLDAPASRAVPRLRTAGTSTVLGAIEAIRTEHEQASVALVTLSWRHRDRCGADQVITANEPRGAAFDLRPPPKPKRKGEPRELPSTLGIDELQGLINVGEMVADMLLDDERAHVVLMDGYPQGQIYARFVVGIAARCVKLRRAKRPVTLPRMTAPADAACKEMLALFKKCRTVEAMRAAAETYHAEKLAHKFP